MKKENIVKTRWKHFSPSEADCTWLETQPIETQTWSLRFVDFYCALCQTPPRLSHVHVQILNTDEKEHKYTCFITSPGMDFTERGRRKPKEIQHREKNECNWKQRMVEGLRTEQEGRLNTETTDYLKSHSVNEEMRGLSLRMQKMWSNKEKVFLCSPFYTNPKMKKKNKQTKKIHEQCLLLSTCWSNTNNILMATAQPTYSSK